VGGSNGADPGKYNGSPTARPIASTANAITTRHLILTKGFIAHPNGARNVSEGCLSSLTLRAPTAPFNPTI
jgi:hypothetical protein